MQSELRSQSQIRILIFEHDDLRNGGPICEIGIKCLLHGNFLFRPEFIFMICVTEGDQWRVKDDKPCRVSTKCLYSLLKSYGERCVRERTKPLSLIAAAPVPENHILASFIEIHGLLMREMPSV